MNSILILFSIILGFASAIPPKWFQNGQCGISKYADAGEQQPLAAPYRSRSSMIVGGIEARPNEFPWQVSIQRINSGIQFCGGSLINEKWILTAAHCLNKKDPKGQNLAVGEHKMDDEDKPNVQVLGTHKIFIHEKYDGFTAENDIALIKVIGSFKLNENVWPICGADPLESYSNKKAEVSGWGKKRFGYFWPIQNILRYTTVNITTQAYCFSEYNDNPTADYPARIVTDDMLCATDNQDNMARDACQGDSGGPLVYKNADGIFSLIGVVSWGYSCAGGFPGVYANVGYQSSWITNIINNN